MGIRPRLPGSPSPAAMRWAVALLLSGPALAGDTSLLLGPGLGNLRSPPQRMYYSFELTRRFDRRPWGAWAAAEVDPEEAYLGGGLCLLWDFGGKWTAALSSGPGWYTDRRPLDLGSVLEFRSTAYLRYTLERGIRIGISVSHYSNAGLGTHNPGLESVRMFVEFPLPGSRSRR